VTQCLYVDVIQFAHNQFLFVIWTRKNVKICFYVNVNLNVNNWFIEYVFTDVYILKLKLRKNQRIINIHNVYNVSSMLYASKILLFVIKNIKHQFINNEEHILLKDFNLQYSLWSDLIYLTQHVTTNQLIDLFIDNLLSLCLFQRTITWKARNSWNTVNLIFMIERLQINITQCKNRSNLN
jgi:hypothetical protein